MLHRLRDTSCRNILSSLEMPSPETGEICQSTKCLTLKNPHKGWVWLCTAGTPALGSLEMGGVAEALFQFAFCGCDKYCDQKVTQEDRVLFQFTSYTPS